MYEKERHIALLKELNNAIINLKSLMKRDYAKNPTKKTINKYNALMERLDNVRCQADNLWYIRVGGKSPYYGPNKYNKRRNEFDIYKIMGN